MSRKEGEPEWCLVKVQRNHLKNRKRSTSKFNRKFSYFPILVAMGCCFGFLYQVFHLTNQYFKYPMSTAIVIQVEQKIQMPALSACFYYPPLLSHRHPIFRYFRRIKELEILDTEPVLTLANIFDMTPDVNGLLAKCYYRVPKSYGRYAENCHKFFNLSKYFMSQYICYRFTPSHGRDKLYNLNDLRNALLNPGMFFQVVLNDIMTTNASNIRLSLFDANGYPKSRFSAVVMTTKRLKSKSALNHFFLSYFKVRNDLLPAPYASNCIHYHEETPFTEKRECEDACLRNMTIRHLNRVSFASISLDAIALKVVSSIDLQNQTVEETYHPIDRGMFPQVFKKWLPSRHLCDIFLASGIIEKGHHFQNEHAQLSKSGHSIHGQDWPPGLWNQYL